MQLIRDAIKSTTKIIHLSTMGQRFRMELDKTFASLQSTLGKSRLLSINEGPLHYHLWTLGITTPPRQDCVDQPASRHGSAVRSRSSTALHL
jgi:hypothetical protein